MLTATELAQRLAVSKGRVSQYVSEGKLAGCYSGEGRARRFDLVKVAAALGRTLDPGQMMGNGATTRRALADIRPRALPLPIEEDGEPESPRPARRAREGGELAGGDPDRYELARTQKAEEEARRLRRQNAEAEGTYVLASEVSREVARHLAQEIAEVDTVLRDGARAVADRLGVDFKSVRQVLVETWRAHRASRSEALSAAAAQALPTDAERAADI